MGRLAGGCAGTHALAIVPERKMLSLPTKSFRVKAVVAVVTIYAFCILLPAIAFALADGRMAPPCLMDDLAVLSTHDHAAMSIDSAAAHHHHGAPAADAGGVTHHHANAGHTPGANAPGAAAPADSDSGKSRPGECCGLFPMVALAGRLFAALAPSRLTSTVIPEMTDAMSGCGPDRIIRPPIA
jgi:hypothetical protein